MRPSASTVRSSCKHLIFVYGTLKRGYTNWQRYLGVAEAHGGACCVGSAQTVEAFPLVVRPAHMAPTTRGPVLMDVPGTGAHISGEVYRVDDRTLEALDILEGVRSGHYYKRSVPALMTTAEEGQPEKRRKTEAAAWLVGQTLSCTAYFFPAQDELLALEHCESYTDEAHALYAPGPVNEAILALCRPEPGAHGLSTSVAHPVAAHVLRLLPGDDLLLALRAFTAAHGIEAAAVLSCVGSTGRTTLRPAGLPTPLVLEGKHEIVSLTGTLSHSAHHLHLAVSDQACVVRGGHLLEGCEVRTTAEVTLGVLDGVAFSRPHDARTGYGELSVQETDGM